jgi:hypothetical protein
MRSHQSPVTDEEELHLGTNPTNSSPSNSQSSAKTPKPSVNLAATMLDNSCMKTLSRVWKVWRLTLKRAKVPYFRLYDLRSTHATRLSAGAAADEWVTQLLRQSDSKVFKKYSQMKLRMQREALDKMNRQANEMTLEATTAVQESNSLCTVPAPVLRLFVTKYSKMTSGWLLKPEIV